MEMRKKLCAPFWDDLLDIGSGLATGNAGGVLGGLTGLFGGGGSNTPSLNEQYGLPAIMPTLAESQNHTYQIIDDVVNFPNDWNQCQQFANQYWTQIGQIWGSENTGASWWIGAQSQLKQRFDQKRSAANVLGQSSGDIAMKAAGNPLVTLGIIGVVIWLLSKVFKRKGR